MSSQKAGFNRRDFLKGSVLVAGGLAVGAATGCAPKGASQSEASETKKYSFETPPSKIKASEVKDTKSADVVVLGAGLAGLCAANAAADAGAKVILLEKRETYTYHGGWNGVIGDRQHKNQGVDIPTDQVMAELMRFGAYNPNQQLHLIWKNESGRVTDKILDMADAAGISYFVDQTTKDHWPYREFQTAVNFLPAMNATLVGMLEQNAIAKGVEILYETPASQLILDDSGKVTGVYGALDEGYVQVNAAKGVIMCTGGYGSNKEMLAAYAPRATKTINNQYAELSNTGDGICMGLWVGGVKQETSCPMLWDGMLEGNEIFVTIARQPWLYVNTLGVRYANEDAPFGYTANQDIQQPESKKWAVWDANWNTDREKFQGSICENMHIPTFWTDESYPNYMKRGVIIEANSLEELADKMGVPKETFLATVERYNQMVEKGVDEDFGKDPAKLTAILKPPFGAAKVGTGILVTCDGLKIDTQMRVLNGEGNPIPGLYAAGNDSGDFFANDYPITVAGVSHGRALTFGWLAGEHAAKA